MDRISPTTLRLVVVGLGACAAIGLWMGLNDSLNRDAPDWQAGPAAATAAATPEAVPYDPASVKLTETAPPPAPAPKVETKAPEPEPEPEPVKTADITERTPTPPPATKPAAPPPAAKAPPPKAPAPKSDPIGDLVQEKTAPAQPPPEVPF